MTTSDNAIAAGTATLGDRTVNRMGFGTMKLTGWPQGRQPTRDTAIALLRRAVELGVNHLDTAEFYDRDGMRATELVHQALHPYPDDLVIVTKLASVGTGLTADGIRRGAEANLRSLGLDQLDVVNLRVGDALDVAEGSIEEPLTALAQLQAEGLVRHIGVSNVTAAQFAQARSLVPIVCVQNAYNITRRADDAIVDACAEAGIAFVPFFPVGGGFQPLALDRLDTVAARHGVAPQQIALAWLLARSPAIALIPGTSDPEHLEQNIAAAEITLDATDLELLDARD